MSLELFYLLFHSIYWLGKRNFAYRMPTGGINFFLSWHDVDNSFLSRKVHVTFYMARLGWMVGCECCPILMEPTSPVLSKFSSLALVCSLGRSCLDKATIELTFFTVIQLLALCHAYYIMAICQHRGMCRNGEGVLVAISIRAYERIKKMRSFCLLNGSSFHPVMSIIAVPRFTAVYCTGLSFLFTWLSYPREAGEVLYMPEKLKKLQGRLLSVFLIDKLLRWQKLRSRSFGLVNDRLLSMQNAFTNIFSSGSTLD